MKDFFILVNYRFVFILFLLLLFFKGAWEHLPVTNSWQVMLSPEWLFFAGGVIFFHMLLSFLNERALEALVPIALGVVLAVKVNYFLQFFLFVLFVYTTLMVLKILKNNQNSK